MSVIVAFRDVTEFLGRTLDSLVAQTFPEFEVLLVDDGSTCAYPDFAAQYGDRLDLRLLKLPARGVSAARNAAAREARGEYLAFLDADDVWLPAKLERQLALAPRAALVYTNLAFIDAHDRPLGKDLRRHYGLAKLPEGDVMHALVRANFLHPSTVMVRRRSFDDLGGFDESLSVAEDWDFALKAARTGEVRAVPEALVLYRRHGASATLTNPRAREQKQIVIERALALVPEGERPALAAHHRAQLHCQHGLALLGRFKPAGLVEMGRALAASWRTVAHELATRIACFYGRLGAR